MSSLTALSVILYFTIASSVIISFLARSLMFLSLILKNTCPRFQISRRYFLFYSISRENRINATVVTSANYVSAMPHTLSQRYTCMHTGITNNLATMAVRYLSHTWPIVLSPGIREDIRGSDSTPSKKRT